MNRMVSRAIDHAYQSQIPKSGFPFAMLKLTVDTHAIDINVHPQKSEIKFGDEQAVYRAVYHALTNALTHPMQGTEKGKDEVTFKKPSPQKEESLAEEVSIFPHAQGRSFLPQNPAFGQPIWRTPEPQVARPDRSYTD